jgi:tetratricopeptide (TPR) repeat protein
MRTPGSISTRRAVTLWAAAALLCVGGGCERKSAEPNAPASQPTVEEAFTPPRVNMIALPLGLQERIRALRQAVELSPDNPDRVGALGAVYFVHGSPEAAAQCFARARDLAPDAMHWWYYLGLASGRAGQRDQAIAAFEKALELDASYAPSYVRLAELLSASDPDRAVKLARRALELNPKNATAVYVLGLCAEARGRPDEAIERFEEALQITPNYRQAHGALARILAGQQRADEAEQHETAARTGRTPVVDDYLFEMVLRNGLHLETLLRDAAAMAQRGDFERAETILETARIVDRTGMPTRRATGAIRTMQGRFEEAAADLRAVLEANPDALRIKAELANAVGYLGQHAEAEALFREVLERRPDDTYALERYSLMLLRLGRFDEGVALLAGALERSPNQPWIRFRLGELMLDAGRNDEAREHFEAYLKAVPDDPRARFSLGVLARRANDLTAAKEHWESVIQTAPGFLQAHMALVEMALEQRDFATAERRIRAGLEQAPEAAGLLNGLAWILATSPDDGQRDGEEAVRLAEKACELTQRRQHETVDTLAAAYAEAGRFDDAVRTAREAIRLAEEANNEGAVADYRERLELYETKQPYRDVERPGD